LGHACLFEFLLVLLIDLCLFGAYKLGFLNRKLFIRLALEK
jgi:hypothetical protein